ncbi:MAG: YceD family protein [Thermosynechococcaceae cyanobacterium MS004]|nr:YceD family protein [Thermosynechococcaceae cyanobacterium MS004]
MVEPIHLPQLLHAPGQSDVVLVQEWFADLQSLTPVQGQVKVVHHGNFLQVDGTAETIVTLTCDRCLQSYNYRLATETSELIWLSEVTESDALQGIVTEDLDLEDLVETLPPDGYFLPDDWLYQQLCLELPQRQLCDEQCPGIEIEHPQSESASPLDYRWASLADLKQQLERGHS